MSQHAHIFARYTEPADAGKNADDAHLPLLEDRMVVAHSRYPPLQEAMCESIALENSLRLGQTFCLFCGQEDPTPSRRCACVEQAEDFRARFGDDVFESKYGEGVIAKDGSGMQLWCFPHVHPCQRHNHAHPRGLCAGRCVDCGGCNMWEDCTDDEAEEENDGNLRVRAQDGRPEMQNTGRGDGKEPLDHKRTAAAATTTTTAMVGATGSPTAVGPATSRRHHRRRCKVHFNPSGGPQHPDPTNTFSIPLCPRTSEDRTRCYVRRTHAGNLYRNNASADGALNSATSRGTGAAIVHGDGLLEESPERVEQDEQLLLGSSGVAAEAAAAKAAAASQGGVVGDPVATTQGGSDIGGTPGKTFRESKNKNNKKTKKKTKKKKGKEVRQARAGTILLPSAGLTAADEIDSGSDTSDVGAEEGQGATATKPKANKAIISPKKRAKGKKSQRKSPKSASKPKHGLLRK